MCVFVYTTLLILKDFAEYLETEEDFMPPEATSTHNIKLPPRSCANLSYRSFTYNPEIVHFNGNLRKRNIFHCDRFKEYEKLWCCMTILFIYTELVCEILYTYRSWHTTM